MFGEEQKTMPSTEERLRKTEKLLLGIVNATKSLLIISDYDLAINQAIATLGKATEVDWYGSFRSFTLRLTGLLSNSALPGLRK